ncbi:hypothetical protein CP533_0325 [Ophiocordyceps camponoti-saundersi (nom. inval.)]|nr:hypothetical protein CP533_0325 [Ophiocordyceps camponoti-saundersi (nom. inval.)]
MRPVSLSADPDAPRPDALPSHTPDAPISCFITTEANLEALDSTAAVLDADYHPKHHAQSSPGGHSSPFSDRSAYQELGYGTVAAPITTGVVDARSVASGLSSLGISSNSSASGDASGYPTNPNVSDPHASMAQHSFHQLVMPSLKVPRRRSFTDVGKSLGNLRILVLGIGKTSLIRSFGQNCQHIVYLDPITPSPTQKITEIFGSTKSCPWWRAESEPVARANKRRKYTTDELLEKNICFADCPSSTGVTGYVESQLMPLCQKPIGDSDLCHLLSEGAGSIVHAALYMLPMTGPRLKDIELLRMLQEMTNVVPVLARADELTDDETILSKRRLLSHLARENLDLFSFAGPDSAPSVYAVSCTAQSESTASEPDLHMSFEHVQHQSLTDLSDLVDRIFSLDGSSWLRYSAAVKSVIWRRRQLELTYHSALTLRTLTYSGALTSMCHFAAGSHHERIELSSWAESLRRSLSAERMRQSYATLPSELERVQLAMTTSGKPSWNAASRRQRSTGQTNNVHQDPLGLLKLSSQINRGGRLTLELVTSLGGVGLAAWLVQPELSCHWDMPWFGKASRPTMREIITLQLGNFSNYTATHFWNVQESYFTYDEDQPPSPVDHNIHWRAGIGHDGRETFLPRTVIYDLKGAFGSLRKINALYDAVPQVDAAESLSLWSGPSTVHKQPALNPGPYQKSLDAGLEPAQLSTSAVRHWSDFSRVYFHPRSLVQLYDYELDSTIRPFDRFPMGHELFDCLAKEHDILDRDWRPFVEECDAMQGIQVVSTLDDAWGGFASTYLEALRDEYPKSSLWNWGLQNPPPFSSPGNRQMRLVNTAQSLIQAYSMTSAVVPLAIPAEDYVLPYIAINRNSLWEMSGLLSTVLETATLPSRLNAGSTTLSDMAEYLNTGGRRPLARAGMIPGRLASEPAANLMDLTPSYPSHKRGRAEPEREYIFGQVSVRRGVTDDEDLINDAFKQKSRQMLGNPVTRRYTSALVFPLLNSFPPLYGDASIDTGGIPVNTALSTDASISARLRSLRSQICPSVSAAEREEMGNSLADIVDTYQQGYSSDSDEGDDDV